MLRVLYAIGVSTAVIASTPTEIFAQAERSPWCADFRHQDKTVHKKSLVVQIKPSNQGLRDAFDFNKVLKHLIAHLGGDHSSQKPESLVLSMTESFKSTRERHPDSGLKMNFDPRAAEASLGGNIGEIFPVGLFYRPDLTNLAKGSCGEARVVFARKPVESVGPDKRFLLIFEANITPKIDARTGKIQALNPGHCRPVTEFWASLSKDPTNRNDLLRDFYFEGQMLNGEKLDRAPLNYENLGGANRGQVRGNIFLEQPWQLREWLLRKHGSGTQARLEFDVVPVKENPLTEFYNAAQATKLDESQRAGSETRQFQSVFVKDMLEFLTGKVAEGGGFIVRGLDPKIHAIMGFNFGPGLTGRFEEFQSTSQGIAAPGQPPEQQLQSGDIPQPDSDLADAIKKRLDEMGSDLSLENIVDRATALTCGGCHQPEGIGRPANRRLEISPGVFWPKSRGNFVHIDEDGEISPALEDIFLPFRAAILRDNLCQRISPSDEPASLILMSSARKFGPALLAADTGVEGIRNALVAAESNAERDVLQEALNDAQAQERRIELSTPGTYWQSRRVH